MNDPAEKGPFTSEEPENIGADRRAGGAKITSPDLHYISAIQIDKTDTDGDADNYSSGSAVRRIHVWCKPIPRVDIMPADMSEKGPFVTKEPPNKGGGAKAEALNGYYISAAQLVVDGDWHHQRSIQFWCKPFPVVATMPDDLSEKGPINPGLDPTNGGFSYKAQIEDGYYLSAIQIVRMQPDWHVMNRTIYMWSKPLPKV
jgi:hypothetical protein